MTLRRIPLWVLLFLLPFCVAAGSGKHSNKSSNSGQQTDAGQAKSDPSKGQSFTSNPADPSLYAGTDTCRTCHDDIAKSFDHGPHWKTTLNHRGVQYQGCEACHGPGKAHVEAGGDITKIIRYKTLTREQSSKRCLSCHEFGEEHANFLRSEHLKNNVGCI